MSDNDTASCWLSLMSFEAFWRSVCPRTLTRPISTSTCPPFDRLSPVFYKVYVANKLYIAKWHPNLVIDPRHLRARAAQLFRTVTTFALPFAHHTLEYQVLPEHLDLTVPPPPILLLVEAPAVLVRLGDETSKKRLCLLPRLRHPQINLVSWVGLHLLH
jgi:hypothetical protein